MDLSTAQVSSRLSGRQSRSGSSYGGSVIQGASTSGYVRSVQAINGYGGHSTIRAGQVWAAAMQGDIAKSDYAKSVDEACPQLTLETIRKIRRHPTVALARAL